MNEDARLKDLLRKKLARYETPVDPADWEIICRRLERKQRKKTVFFRWTTGATAAAAVAALYLLFGPSALHRPLPDETGCAVAVAPPSLVALPSPAAAPGKLPTVLQVPACSPTARSANRGQTTPPAKRPQPPVALSVVPPEPATDTSQTTPAMQALAFNDEKATPDEPIPTATPDSFARFFPIEEPAPAEKATGKKWALALLANQSNDMHRSADPYFTATLPQRTPVDDIASEATNTTSERVETTHQIPLSFGLTFRYYLNAHWAIESGLVYTYLSSEYRYRNDDRMKQQLHYLGLPVHAVYQFVDNSWFSVYLSGGGRMEKGLGAHYSVFSQATRANRNETIDGLQWSLNGQMGVSYHLTKRFSLYAEPGVRYFFPNATQPESIRTERPFHFSLSFGIRTDFGN
jgi:hypothetical protein